ncbi:MAG: NAD+ synthase, partial [Bacteroidales bacterium]|nr:NAD+ synthase [Bacteroidales bacterium]
MIGDFEGNRVKILSSINGARERGCDLIVFSELCICGYPPLDLLEHKYFIDRCREEVDEIAAEVYRDSSKLSGHQYFKHQILQEKTCS